MLLTHIGSSSGTFQVEIVYGGVIYPPHSLSYAIEARILIQWVWFNVRWKPLTLPNMLDTSNVGFGCVENILEAFEVERFIKKLVETQTFVQWIWLQIFWEGKFTPP